jgi:hypothetical protein
VFFTGELVDFDSTASAFLGVHDATFTVRGDTSRTAQTAPNGRFELCLGIEPQTLVDVTPAPGSGYIGGIAVVTKEVAPTGVYSIRSFTMDDGERFFGYLADRAQVYVHVAGNPRTVTISAASERAYAFDGTSWQGGEDRGTDVFFSNVDPAGGET